METPIILQLPHFDIDASVVRQLGEELITDEVSAIMELVKNAYDADADWVRIEINSIDPTNKASKGFIIIEDNGIGMSYDDITKKWLVISLSDKRAMKAQNKTTAKGRIPLGDKGVGRLSTQRLGYTLELVSGIKDEHKWHHLSFDWRDFASNVSLTNVPLTYKSTNKTKLQKGSKLIIGELINSTVWEKEAADRFRGQLSQLVFPYKDQRPFSVYLTINGQKHDLDEINDNLRDQATGRYTFSFDGKDKLKVKGELKIFKLRSQGDTAREEFEKLILADNGKDFFNFLTDRTTNKSYFLTGVGYVGKGWLLEFEREISLSKDFSKGVAYLPKQKPDSLPSIASPGKFNGEIDEYDLRGPGGMDETIFSGVREYKTIVTNQVGVRVFRDGFGIKPYGFDGNDWLNLGSGQTSGGSFYGLRPNNVIGFVSIGMKDNSQLKELTSREGFTDSPYSRNFLLLMSRVVQEVNDILERMRRSYNAYKQTTSKGASGFQSVVSTTRQIKETARQAQDIEQRSRQAEQSFKEVSHAVQKEVEKIKKEPLFSSPSDTTHLPLLQQIESLLGQASTLFSQINSILSTAQRWENSAEYIGAKVEDLENQLAQFSELAGLGLTAEALTHDLYILLDRINSQTDSFSKQLRQTAPLPAVFTYVEYVRSFTRDLRKQLSHLAPSLRFNREKRERFSINEFCQDLNKFYQLRFVENGIELLIECRRDFTVYTNKGKLTQVFDNLILNSEYWLRERVKQDLTLKPKITVHISDPLVRISDNGFGIAEYIEDRIFQPFVTTKPKEVGRGLGLFIVQQMLDSMDADIILLQERNLHGRRYIFQLNLDALTNK